MSLSVRRATNADIDDVVRVIRAVYDEYGFPWEKEGYHADLYDLERFYDAAGDRFYVAEMDGTVVGTAALEVFPTVPGGLGEVVEHEGYLRVGGTDCSLERLYVHPDARKVGAGTLLLRHVFGEAREAGASHLEMWSDKKFGDAHRLYGRFGAEVVGERLCDDPDQSPEWGLIVNLKGPASQKEASPQIANAPGA